MATELKSSKYRCPQCAAGDFAVTTTQWRCTGCGQTYACASGIPRLFVEDRLGSQDRKLRDTFYDGLFGRLYQVTMPAIVMPVRPLAMSWPYWIAYGVMLALILGLAAGIISTLAAGAVVTAALLFAALALILWLLSRQSWLLHLMWVAFPAWLSLSRKPWVPPESFAQVHERVLAPLRDAERRLQILDVSTGSCNSLYRHGWMSLDADYTAIDLSETMLKQGSDLMSAAGVPVDLVLGDAMELPFQNDSFDVVLSYGAVNGLTDPAKAIAEMARVARPGGTLLFLDEQMYDAATPVQRAYFMKVLSSHNVIHHCPVETFPPTLTDVRVSQVYQFYYICTARKAG
ncbi:class I SAM-dependent methyltransferase [uncultured Brevundimonas sp.]|uniref:class I SAM-dependent methyltransferase n=1 Tax=uncultured Brevundimonas sp. TaxID=213418 RepID=UPI0030EB73E2|tara:strand:- start:153326 stop:154360 length:1035 start_codon:yes stop_codon:yes gene_type:complete